MRGRFAPSPTGPLHFGSLIAAVASFLEVKTQAGKWLLRIEDLDKPREQLGAVDAILSTLEAFGFEWDEEVIYQSQRKEWYESALQKLATYPCSCSRREIADSAIPGVDGYIYPKTCFKNSPSKQQPCAYRLITTDTLIEFEDAIQGTIKQNIAHDFGDFILKRADGIFAYQLAVVVDDFAQGVTHVTRGADLLDSTTRQIYLQIQLGYPTPQYTHLPVALSLAGEKLSKQTLAPALNTSQAAQLLCNALQFLGQNPPQALQTAPINLVWQWALSNWSVRNVPRQKTAAEN